MPDNLPQVTEAIKPVLGDYYNYDSTVRSWFSMLVEKLMTSDLYVASALCFMALVHPMYICRKWGWRPVPQESIWGSFDWISRQSYFLSLCRYSLRYSWWFYILNTAVRKAYKFIPTRRKLSSPKGQRVVATWRQIIVGKIEDVHPCQRKHFVVVVIRLHLIHFRVLCPRLVGHQLYDRAECVKESDGPQRCMLNGWYMYITRSLKSTFSTVRLLAKEKVNAYQWIVPDGQDSKGTGTSTT